MSKWIKVCDRLPKENVAVLVYSSSKAYRQDSVKFIALGFYSKQCYWHIQIEDGWVIANPSHWMELPLPPTQEEYHDI